MFNRKSTVTEKVGEKLKVHLVTKGYSQLKGGDYHEILSWSSNILIVG